MSDTRKSPGQSASNPGNPVAPDPGSPPQVRITNPGTLPARGTNPGTLPARGGTNPGMKVISATRAQPPPPEAPTKLQEKVKTRAVDLGLNVVSILKEAYEDFKRSDRYFKYKAGIVSGWVLISVLTIFASCPRSELDARNRLGARLGPMPPDPSRPAVTIFNDSAKPWKDVLIIVNEKYRASMPLVDAGDAVTVTPKQLLGPGGKVAPGDLRAVDVELRTDDGKARLMKEGLEQ